MTSALVRLQALRIQRGDVELNALVGNPLSTVWFGTAVGIRAGQFLAKSPGLVLLGAGLVLAGAWEGIGHVDTRFWPSAAPSSFASSCP